MSLAGSSGQSLHFRVTGPSRGPAILFLHGFMGSALDWDDIVADLKDDYQCVGVDLPGHGRSVGLTPDRYSVEDVVKELSRILTELGIRTCVPVGYSMGGRVALSFGLNDPERCAGLVLESTSPGIERAEKRLRRLREDEERAEELQSDFENFLSSWYDQPLFESVGSHMGLWTRLIVRRRENDPAELARALVGLGPGRMSPMWERLGDLTVSTLALAGEMDQKYVGMLDEMKRAAPSLRTTVVPGAGHNVHLEQPACFIAIVRRFLTDTLR